ncbi:hypothetical protein AMECASPLE_015615 [Ameca splendens]|uniref:Uncharacterized protein n=1 Tax=Ameca splendens TaxID=208324 RepID=A0ABV0Y2C0_9TELE
MILNGLIRWWKVTSLWSGQTDHDSSECFASFACSRSPDILPVIRVGNRRQRITHHQTGGASICCLPVSTQHGDTGFYGASHGGLFIESRTMPPVSTSLGSPDSPETEPVWRAPPPIPGAASG